MSPQFEAEWERCSPWIEAALEHCHGTHQLEDVKALVLDPLAETHFWPGKKAAAVSQIMHHPRCNQMHFWLCGGSLREIVNDMLPAAHAFGVLHGCTLYTTAGVRTTWRRVLSKYGYEPAWDLLARKLT